MKLTSLLVLLLCNVWCSDAVNETKQSKGGPSVERHLKKSKKGDKGSKSSSSSTEDDAAADYGRPSAKPDSEDEWASGNVFDLSSKDTPVDDPGETDKLDSGASSKMPQYVTTHVSVAVGKSTLPSDLKIPVAKVITKIVRSYTPFNVYMLDGNRRELQTTGLQYDPKVSTVSLAFHDPQVSWWTYNVAYKVTMTPEEVEEASEIDELAESAVEGSILSGLFEQLLAPVAPAVRGTSVPGHELDYVWDDNEPKATSAKPTESGANEQGRSLVVGLSVVCLAVIMIIAIIFIMARRRRHRASEAHWAMRLGEQEKVGRILNTSWDAPSVTSEQKGAFSLFPEENSSYMFGRWDQGGADDGTAEATDEATAQDSANLSVDNGSFS